MTGPGHSNILPFPQKIKKGNVRNGIVYFTKPKHKKQNKCTLSTMQSHTQTWVKHMWNVMEHCKQLKGFPSVWALLWVYTLCMNVNDLEHSEQPKGLPPVWTLKRSFKGDPFRKCFKTATVFVYLFVSGIIKSFIRILN